MDYDFGDSIVPDIASEYYPTDRTIIDYDSSSISIAALEYMPAPRRKINYNQSLIINGGGGAVITTITSFLNSGIERAM
jgi:hypothetical protein